MALFGIKIKPLKIIGKVVMAAGPLVVTAVAGPAIGATAAAAVGGTVLVKKGGKMASRAGLGNPHKVAAPLAILGFPALGEKVIRALTSENPEQLAEAAPILAKLNEAGVPPWLAVGVFLWLVHQFGKNIEKSGNGTPEG